MKNEKAEQAEFVSHLPANAPNADSELKWLSKSTYAEYNSSPGCYRAFCSNCGSPLLWISSEAKADVELAVGTFDEEFLIGKKDPDGYFQGGYGVALANPNGDHFYVENEIKGVTEDISRLGTRYLKTSKEGAI
ncbi:hypothetical protein F5884DRAFT_752670 [Xylogone sp. PMI_703]|nr:hypothetical protein F5884DRAFT_752670 [Xylogone sp. PMI_703]